MRGEPSRAEAPRATGATGAEDDGPVGPFPSWGWLYGVVLAYGVLVILLLILLSRLLDPGTA